MEPESPLILQSDQGSEFKGDVNRLCRKMQVKMINSRPYHPQSQGKVERSHRALRSKVEYDLMKMGKKGHNWVKALPERQKILNEDPKEVLKYKSPFEVYFARKPSNHQSRFLEGEASASEELVANTDRKCNPTNKDRERRFRFAKDVRKAAYSATECCHRRMVKNHLKCNPPSRYRVGEKVYVRMAKKGITKTSGKQQFASLAYQLHSIGIARSPETMRDEIVRYLETNPLDEDGFPLFEWVPHFNSWSDYLAHMARDHTYGDQLTLYAAANLYNVNIQIVSSLGAGAGHVFHPTSTIPVTTLYLGHFAENHGEHYIALNGHGHGENYDDIPAGNDNNQAQERSHNKCHSEDDNCDFLVDNVNDQAKEVPEEEHDDDHMHTDSAVNRKENLNQAENDDGEMSADSVANQVERESLEEEMDDEEDDEHDEVSNQLPNEILDKIIDYALTGAKSSIITTFRSLGLLDDCFKRLASRYICRLPQVSYSHRDTLCNRYFSKRTFITFEASTTLKNKSRPISEVGNRQERRKLKEVKTKAKKALWFLESFGLSLGSIKVKDKDSKESDLRYDGSDSGSKTSFHNLTEKDKDTVRALLYIIDKCCAGNASYNELSMTLNDVPRRYLIKLKKYIFVCD
ncbi:hypothetical protein ACROYT_G040633 [Oculina patagonica]